MNATLDPALRSWVEPANDPHSDFPIQNLPFGIFRRLGEKTAGRIGIAIGDQILDAAAAGITECHSSLNPLMALGLDAASLLRETASKLLRHDSQDRSKAASSLAPMRDCEMLRPVEIGGYTDFYSSVHHAANVGRLFRPDNPLLPNYKYVPIGYHGRASSIVVSGTPVRRPRGQTRPSPDDPPRFGPSAKLDYELELGFFVGRCTTLGSAIPISRANDHIMGFCLVNDWSARDIQAWEYQPLGPFLAKSFGTTISPWVVSVDALSPFRVPAYTRPESDPAPLEYLDDPEDRRAGGIDVNLEVWIETETMRRSGAPPARLSRGNFSDMYWTVAQMLTHQTSNGCNLQTGDLLASGTVSGPEPEARGCLLELTRGGAEPVRLPSGEQRQFLEDGDEIILRGRCEREGFVAIGFGECRGRIIASS